MPWKPCIDHACGYAWNGAKRSECIKCGKGLSDGDTVYAGPRPTSHLQPWGVWSGAHVRPPKHAAARACDDKGTSKCKSKGKAAARSKKGNGKANGEKAANCRNEP